MPGIPFLSHLPFPIWLFYMRLFLMLTFFFLNYCFRGSDLRLQNFSIHLHHLYQTYLGCNHFAFRRLLLIICLHSAQFNRTLILAGAFLKPLYCHTGNSNNIQLQKSPAQTSNTVGECLGTAVKSRKWLLRQACNWTELICSFRLKTTNFHFSQPQKK